MHKLKIPTSWQWTMFYSLLVAVVCEAIHFGTTSLELVETVQLEVLLPAFVLGCMARHGHDSHLKLPEAKGRSRWGIRLGEDEVATIISAVFMVLVGLSMPPLFSEPEAVGHRRLLGAGRLLGGEFDDGDDDDVQHMDAWTILMHVVAVSFFMVVGKMFPTLCYRKEASIRTRLALSLGMCPRGEVGAGVIVISLNFGVSGPAVSIAVLCLALNLVLSSGFVMAVKILAAKDEAAKERQAALAALAAASEYPSTPNSLVGLTEDSSPAYTAKCTSSTVTPTRSLDSV